MNETHMINHHDIRPNGYAPIRHIGWVVCVLLIVTCILTRDGFSSTILIDNFAQPNPNQFFTLGSGMNPSLALSQTSSGAIGGQRDSQFNVIGAGKPNSTVGLLGYDTKYFINAFQLGTNGLSPTVSTLQYSGTNTLNSATSLVNAQALGNGLGIDLTDGDANNRFEFLFYSSDAQPTSGLDLAITITSPGGKSSTATAIVPNSLAAFNFDVPFSQLAGNASISNVSSITFTFNGAMHTPNVDFELEQIAAVPEPSSGILMLTAVSGALSFTWLRSFRQKQNGHRSGGFWQIFLRDSCEGLKRILAGSARTSHACVPIPRHDARLERSCQRDS